MSLCKHGTRNISKKKQVRLIIRLAKLLGELWIVLFLFHFSLFSTVLRSSELHWLYSTSHLNQNVRSLFCCVNSMAVDFSMCSSKAGYCHLIIGGGLISVWWLVAPWEWWKKSCTEDLLLECIKKHETFVIYTSVQTILSLENVKESMSRGVTRNKRVRKTLK